MPSLRLGDTAPDFEQDSSLGRIRFHEWLGSSWGVLFSHPADFTPVCTTELGLTATLKPEFGKRDVKVIALSVDSVESHQKWIDDINFSQHVQVRFPIIADADRKVSQLYDLIHPNASSAGAHPTFSARSTSATVTRDKRPSSRSEQARAANHLGFRRGCRRLGLPRRCCLRSMRPRGCHNLPALSAVEHLCRLARIRRRFSSLACVLAQSPN